MKYVVDKNCIQKSVINIGINLYLHFFEPKEHKSKMCSGLELYFAPAAY